MSSLQLDVTEFIKGRRTISFGNILERFNIDKKELAPIIDSLEVKKMVRTVNSACTLDCSSCSTSTCGDKVMDKYREQTIVVSLHL